MELTDESIEITTVSNCVHTSSKTEIILLSVFLFIWNNQADEQSNLLTFSVSEV